MCKKSSFKRCINKQHGKRAVILLKSASRQFHYIYWSLSKQLSWKQFLLLTCQILGLLVNTLAVDDKYPVLYRENLTIPIEIQLSQKQKNLFGIFYKFLKSRLNFEHFEKKDDPHRFCISEITDSENVVRYMFKKPRFKERINKQLGKRA